MERIPQTPLGAGVGRSGPYSSIPQTPAVGGYKDTRIPRTPCEQLFQMSRSHPRALGPPPAQMTLGATPTGHDQGLTTSAPMASALVTAATAKEVTTARDHQGPETLAQMASSAASGVTQAGHHQGPETSAPRASSAASGMTPAGHHSRTSPRTPAPIASAAPGAATPADDDLPPPLPYASVELATVAPTAATPEQAAMFRRSFATRAATTPRLNAAASRAVLPSDLPGHVNISIQDMNDIFKERDDNRNEIKQQKKRIFDMCKLVLHFGQVDPWEDEKKKKESDLQHKHPELAEVLTAAAAGLTAPTASEIRGKVVSEATIRKRTNKP